MQTFLSWLDDICARVRQLEEQGRAACAAGEAERYRDLMRQKAETLAALFKEAPADDLPEDVRERVRCALKRFSASARQALALDSVFYMSALLYRDDHKEGEPNNLEVFRDELRAADKASL